MNPEVDSEAVSYSALTRSQLMIWTGQRLQRNEPLYNMALSFQLNGAIDLVRFQLAHDQVVANCDALRTTFVEQNKVPKQRFHEHYRYRIECIDFSDNENKDLAVKDWQDQRARKIFDLSQCLFDSVLLKLEQNKYVWFFNQHHLTTDAWSTALIYRTLQHYYTMAREGLSLDAEVMPDFRQYVAYENEQQSTNRMRRAKEYWNKELSVRAPASEFFRSTPRDRGGQTRRVACNVDAHQSRAIKQLATNDRFRALTDDLSRFQLFATLLFAWIFRITGNRIVSIGTPSHNRGTARHKKTVGLFIEIYPLQIELEEDETFASLYAKVARKTQYMLMNAVPGGSGFEHNRAYDVLLNYITVNFGDFDHIPMESQWVHAGYGDRNHLVRMQIEDFDSLDRFRVFFDLNEDVFVGEEQQRPGEQYLALLDAFIKNADTQVAEVNLLSDKQVAALTNGFPAPDLAINHETLDNQITLVEQIIRQAKKSPDAVALVAVESPQQALSLEDKKSNSQTNVEQKRVTYRQLLFAIEHVATQLSDHDIQLGERVAIMLPRSIEAVVSILALMYRGISYVPIDAGYPRDRVHFMLNDAGVEHVICHQDDETHGCNRIVLKVDYTEPQNLDNTLLQPTMQGSAYVLFTSGSTGQPKGVDVGHLGLRNYVNWAAAFYTNSQPMHWALFTSLSFDLTVTSLFVPLVTGGRLLIYSEQESQRDILVRRVISDNRIDAIKLTPAHLALLQALDLSQSKLRCIIVGGEDFKVGLAHSVDNYFGGKAALYNEYGPTEGTVGCMIHRYVQDTDRGKSVPIGRAIDNAKVYILNGAFQVQPQGVVGELFIGGMGVAKGYLNRPKINQERFIADPFVSGGTLYRTGDLARLDEDENVVYVGRRDEQVKINGVRIELGDIEATLLKHPDVTHATANLTHYQAQDRQTDEQFCVRCGLSGLHPSALLDNDNVCKICYVYEAERERALAYFGTPEELHKIVSEIKAQHRSGSPTDPDCMMLLSGGKDSTFALCQIVDLGLRPLVFTLDNGFISQGAKANMRRVVEHLGLEFIEASTPAMNDIFRDSLQRFSNVCNGCFKTIYTLSMKVAQERGIRHIFTGLSRGQIFETRVADLFRQRVFDNSRIDALIIEARKAYHRAEDAVSKALDTQHLDDDSIFERIQYVDYYRYTDVSLGQMLTYLRDRVPWVRPADTGRSTNCLINEAGIFVHKKERGFHNYSLPYSWDVRLGHKERDAAREELDDNINLDNVDKILSDVGYVPREMNAISEGRKMLVGYYVADEALSSEALTAHLKTYLPDDYVPTHFVKMDSLPLTTNGKVDKQALPLPDLSRPELKREFQAASGQVETILAKIWARVFGLDRIGVQDNFFELGGDSIVNIQIVSLAAKEGVLLTPQQVFDYPTIAELRTVVGTAEQLASEQGVVSGEVELTPIQRRYFAHKDQSRHQYAQAVRLEVSESLDHIALEEALRILLTHHDILRCRFEQIDSRWHAKIPETNTQAIPIKLIKAELSNAEQADVDLKELANQLAGSFDLSNGPLIQVGVIESDQLSQVIVCIHHLIVDAVSWWILLEDLEDCYSAIVNARAVELPLKTTSFKHWSSSLVGYANSQSALKNLPLWNKSHDELVTLKNKLESPLPTHSQMAVSDKTKRPPSKNYSTDNLAISDTLGSWATHSVSLDQKHTKSMMTDVTMRWRTQPQDVLLLALARTLSAQYCTPRMQFDVESHGRENISKDVDLLRTVGWFTSVYPITVDAPVSSVDDGVVWSAQLRQLRDNLRGIPHGGISYGALRYLNVDANLSQQLRDQVESPILVNYMGTWRKQAGNNTIFSIAEPLVATSPDDRQRRYQFEVNAVVFNDCLHVEWGYDGQRNSSAFIEELASELLNQLTKIVAYCARHEDTKVSAKDFPSAALEQGDLDDLLAEFGES